MGIRGAVVAGVIAASASIAGAQPAPALAWTAPLACPDADEASARVERHLGEPIDRFVLAVAVQIDQVPHGYVAHVGTRTLTSETCDDLSDAVALVVARMATEAPRRIAPIRTAWGGGVRGSGMSGIGVVPSVGLGGELAAYLRREQLLGELAIADWAQGATLARGLVPAGMMLGLETVTMRIGYAPEPKPIRSWLAVDVGRMTGESGAQATTASAWVAAGPGFAVAWPIAPRLRLVGTLEVLANLTRAHFVEDGMTVYEPSAVSARTTLGLEVGWR